MRWLIVIAIVIALAVIVMSDKKSVDVNKMMAKCRLAKKKKAEQKVTYTPPAKSEGGLMKVA